MNSCGDAVDSGVKKNIKPKTPKKPITALLEALYKKVTAIFSGAKLINSVRGKCSLLSLQIRNVAPQSSQLCEVVAIILGEVRLKKKASEM